jgi:hypothetical protein
MTEQNAADRLASILLPYCRSELVEEEGPDHDMGWWFAGAPPAVVKEALTPVIYWEPGERPNDQPPEEWLVDQAERRGGVLAGFAAPKGPDSPRMRVDAIIVPCSQAEDLAAQIARLWPIEGYGTALDLAEVEGLTRSNASRREWGAPGWEFLSWRAGAQDWLALNSAVSGGTDGTSCPGTGRRASGSVGASAAGAELGGERRFGAAVATLVSRGRAERGGAGRADRTGRRGRVRRR